MSNTNTESHEELIATIHEHYGFIPPFFMGMVSVPEFLHTFWQETQSAYIQNPLPDRFKELLFIYLSYTCDIPYDLRGHCITLHIHGVAEEEIIRLLQTPAPDGRDIAHHLRQLSNVTDILTHWPINTALENSLFKCITYLFLQKQQASECRRELQRIFGTQYVFLIGLLTYISSCHQWIEADPARYQQTDAEVEEQFNQYFVQQGDLHQLLQAQIAKVMQERQELAEQKAALLEKQQEFETKTNQSLDAFLAVAEHLVLGTNYNNAQHDRLSSQTAVQRLLELTGSILDSKRIGIMMIDAHNERMQPVALAGFSRDQERQWWRDMSNLKLDEQFSEENVERIKRGEVLIINQQQLHFNGWPNGEGNYHILVAGMQVDNQIAGVLMLDHGDIEHVYNDNEQRFAQAIAHLIGLVLERTHLLREQTEARAREMALQESNQRMNDFLSIVAHELKTPLTTIKGTIQVLLRRITKELQQASEILTLEDVHRNDDITQRLLERSDGQVRRLSNLVDDILYVTRIQEHSLSFYFEQIDLRNILQQAVEQQKKLNPTRQLAVQIAEYPILVRVDRHHIARVIDNYISNALKYSSKNQPVIISVKQTDRQAQFTVQDNGVGILPEDQGRIWERFYRARNTEIRSGSGIGLGMGLYISRAVIQGHGGEVGMKSRPGEGSSFWFTLRLAEA